MEMLPDLLQWNLYQLMLPLTKRLCQDPGMELSLTQEDSRMS